MTDEPRPTGGYAEGYAQAVRDIHAAQVDALEETLRAALAALVAIPTRIGREHFRNEHQEHTRTATQAARHVAYLANRTAMDDPSLTETDREDLTANRIERELFRRLARRAQDYVDEFEILQRTGEIELGFPEKDPHTTNYAGADLQPSPNIPEGSTYREVGQTAVYMAVAESYGGSHFVLRDYGYRMPSERDTTS